MEEKTTTIFDNHGRPITYLRIAVTDRCNLRCSYCMPAEGIQYTDRKELLSYEEMLRITDVLTDMGIKKVRITGGEPFLRKDLIHFLEKLTENQKIEQVNITTNGILTSHYIDDLERLGITQLNLSLDTLDPIRFQKITRRDEFQKVKDTLDLLISRKFKVKLNAVIMEGLNEEDILPLVEYTRSNPVDVRFIEEMPFNGTGARFKKIKWNYQEIFKIIKQHFPEVNAADIPPHSTSIIYQIPGHLGKVGIIPAYSRTFCGSCNRIRLTAQGHLKTCLYDKGVVDIKKVIRSGASDDELKEIFLKSFNQRSKNGFEAEKARPDASSVSESMSTIGG